MKIILQISVLFSLLISSIGFSEPSDDEMLSNLRKMRSKQQDEELVVRVQTFRAPNQKKECTPVQQIRARMNKVNESDGASKNEDVTINAGHGTLNVTSNQGEINSSINVQIIKQGEEDDCL